ncbi:MAG: tautomerase family protein [Magnetospiraceae bacterium]
MPVVHFHLLQDALTPEREAAIVTGASQAFAEVLESPVDRIRAFIHAYSGTRCAVGGVACTDPDHHAPYFEFIVLKGRTTAQQLRLMADFTALLARVLSVDPGVIRGRCIRVEPEEWCIAGKSAAEVRKAEIDAREKANASHET